MIQFLSLIFVALLISTSYFDIKSRRIPNWLILIGVLPLLFKANLFLVIAAVLALFSALLFGRYLGAGDIKLAFLIAAYSHLLSLPQIWIYFALISGGIFAVFTRQTRQSSIAFAPFMAFGVVIAYSARAQSII